ncbi:MAG: 50S ribosomal protein L11 methyltransferase [Moraxellaceae bacterium]|nr:50S ribosomal protein L11 methyltransferase [Moraxellaceae bacterium]
MSDAALLTQSIAPFLLHARINAVTLPDCAGLQLYLLNDDFPHDALSPEEMDWALNEPSYWMFCWASGLAQARQILQQPELVRGKTVLDFGAGSGVVAVAAAKAGAKRVISCDIDPLSLQASAANARLNGVQVELLDDFFQLNERVDVLFAADVLYDSANRSFLPAFLDAANEVWLTDSRVKSLTAPHYQRLYSVMSETLPDLNEFDEFRLVNFYYGRREQS